MMGAKRFMVGLVLAFGAVLGWLAAPTAHAAVDISGEWTITFSGDVDTTCGATIVQTGDALDATLRCGLPDDGRLNGTIDPDSGAFNLELTFDPVFFNLAGVASPDGQTLSGSWHAVGFTGTFSGVRGTAMPTPPSPLSCPASLDGALCSASGDNGSGADEDEGTLPDVGGGPTGENDGSNRAVLLPLISLAALIVSVLATLIARRSSPDPRQRW
jgi:hypothetical protein